MSLPVLLPDLSVEIISWLPLKPVVRFKCVSKHYQSIISDPKFAKLHLQRSPKNPHTLLTLRDVDDDDEEIWVVAPYIVRHLIEHPSSVVEEDECRRFNDNNDYYTIGSINGLVCLISKKEKKTWKHKNLYSVLEPYFTFKIQRFTKFEYHAS
ncbi:putative F-box domain-containing protein [Medicago truncatula]|uniref:Putative F-box domain-containing protein n=1 Tax=Medicago truncatula TaxID=3880 RepID=A0A396JFM0_MEDTR|nr:putative F-box domain-containing protein [Medicago truncatula]